MKTTGVLTVLVVGAVFSTVLLVGVSTRKEQGCSVKMNTALIYQRVSSTFPPDEDGYITKEVFVEDGGRLFVQAFGGIFPGKNLAFSLDAVLVFSARDSALVLFYKNSCLVFDALVNAAVYAKIKAQIRGTFREMQLTPSS